MAENHATNGRTKRVPAFLREPLVAAQARLEQFENEAQRVVKDLMERGRASRKDLEHVVERLSRQDWVAFRAEAMARVMDVQGRAIAFLGVATRDQVEELSREIDRLAKRIEKSAPVRRGRRPSSAEG